jgi:DNA polymerase-3 subunit gamma/tau
MSTFVVSARKYRPSRFVDVVGQEHVTQTLKNALINDHLAHAFLFCGPRGVGKTTCARILAKVLNCQNLSEDAEPCNTCSSCQAFNDNASFNIMELDAASNNSVEHIRALIEQVRFQPQQGKYKVFIIDEVHMLSQQAFNAFLKTLEEPPSYAIFILATTEKHKIIPTILSRCQIFDFKRIQVPRMVKHLNAICEEEGIEVEKDALHIIGQKADGALRDALSIFDRVVSFSGKKITYQDVIDNLNVLDYDYYFKIVDAFMMEDVSKVMLSFDDILRKGFDPDIFISGLAEHVRNLLVCKDEATLQLLEVSDNLKSRYQTQANLAPASFLLTLLSLLNDCDIHYRMARNKRLHVEMALIKMTYINRAVKIAEGKELPEPVSEKKKSEPLTQKQVPEKKKVTPEPQKEEKTSPIPNGGTPSLENNDQEPPATLGEENNDQPATDNEQQTTDNRQPTTDNQQLKEYPSSSAQLSGKPTPEESTPRPGKIRTSNKHSHAKLDLNAMLEEVKQDTASFESAIKEVTMEELREQWNEYAEAHLPDSMKTYVKKAELKINDLEIKALVGSDLAKSTLQQESGLMEHLRTYFNQPKLSLKIKLDKSKAPKVDKPKRLLSSKEKLRQMNEKNPLIKEVWQRFDLRFDED